jgi:hypothetical protein
VLRFGVTIVSAIGLPEHYQFYTVEQYRMHIIECKKQQLSAFSFGLHSDISMQIMFRSPKTEQEALEVADTIYSGQKRSLVLFLLHIVKTVNTVQ